MGVQPVRLPDICELTGPGRPRLQVPVGVQDPPGALPQHLQRGPSAASSALPDRTRGPQLGPDQLRQGMGPEVLPPGDHGLSRLAGDPHGSLQVTGFRQPLRT